MTFDSWLWHRRLGHVTNDTIKKLIQLDLVRGIPLNKIETEGLCNACVKGK